VVERWLCGGGSGGVEASSAGASAGAGPDLVGNGVFSCERGGVGQRERVPVEVAGLVGPAPPDEPTHSEHPPIANSYEIRSQA
jgi:hypothetical protein